MKKMRSATILKITAWACLLVFSVGVLIYGLNTGFGVPDWLKEKADDGIYDVAHTYEEEIKSLRQIDVNWISGPVTVRPHKGELLQVTESSGAALQEDEKLYLEISGGKLSVKWNSALLQLGLQQERAKQLEILVPQAFYDTLEEVHIETLSGNIELESLTLQDAVFETGSGDLHLKDISAEHFSAETVSGNLLCQNIAGTEELRVSSNSGNITLAGAAAGAVTVDTTSGDVTLSGAMLELQCNTVSGDVQMDLSSWPERMTYHSASGDADILAPATEDGFVCRFTGVSGELDSDFAMKKTGDTYTCGKGTCSVRINTTSGNVSLNQKVG